MNSQPDTYTQLHGRWLIVARGLWVTVVLLALGLFVAAIPARFDLLLSSPIESPEYGRALQQLGLSAPFAAVYFIALEVAFAVVFSATAAVIFWRKSDDWMTIFVSLTLVTYGTTLPSTMRVLLAIQPAWRFPVVIVQAIGGGSILIYYYTFPDGRFVPRWTRMLTIVWVAWAATWYVFPTLPFMPPTWPVPLIFLAFMIWYGIGVFAQVYRYVRVSSPVQRQQTKWVMFGFTLAVLGWFGFRLPYAISPSLFPPSTANQLFYLLVGLPVSYFFQILAPLSIGISILRYRLWDIDIIINRALVYGGLTGTLAVVYLVSVILLQRLLPIESQLAIVASTLSIAALFNPLRQRIQNDIDRLFYRRKYDAQQVLAAFAETARDETDLDRLTDELMRVVEETMQPAHVSLWLKPTSDMRSRTGKGQTQ